MRVSGEFLLHVHLNCIARKNLCYWCDACGAGCAVDMPIWWIWAYWADPLAYAVRGLVINEFSAPRWNVPNPAADFTDTRTLGQATLDVRLCL